MYCATDWTFDQFVEDSKLYEVKPIKGVHCRRNASGRERFMTYLKDMKRDFVIKWNEEHSGHWYDRYDGWIGDRFAEVLINSSFSDLYKDAYGQRPHLDIWFYVHMLDLPCGGDTSRMFCASPIEDAIRFAKMVRASNRPNQKGKYA